MSDTTPPPPPTRWTVIRNDREETLTLVLEPWAVEYPLATGEAIDVAEEGGDPEERLEIYVKASRLVLYARTDSVLRAFQNGQELA